ncbi:uncharacterized protein [Haliotis asinina]|uniref:uncharacterized protein n=1 Tax=Haliotis asinina TaxID=109174 RepID=UPI0035326445
MIIGVACLIAVLAVTAVVMGCCFMQRTKLQTRGPAVSLPRQLVTNAYTYTDTREEHMPSCGHRGLVTRPTGSGYDRLRIGHDNLLKFTDMEQDPAQIYSHLATQEADWADEDDMTLRKLGRKPGDKSYDRVAIQEK